MNSYYSSVAHRDVNVNVSIGFLFLFCLFVVFCFWFLFALFVRQGDVTWHRMYMAA